jgi:hypothetical protein
MFPSISLALMCSSFVVAQSSDPKQPQSATVCELLSEPLKFSGTFVKVSGRVRRWHHAVDISNSDCKYTLLLESPEEIEPPPFEVTRDELYSKFEHAMQRYKPGANGSNGFEATIQGRFDYVLFKDKNGKYVRSPQGYGHLNASPARLVIQSVSSVSVHRE